MYTKRERIYELSHIHTQSQELPAYDQLVSSRLPPVAPTWGYFEADTRHKTSTVYISVRISEKNGAF